MQKEREREEEGEKGKKCIELEAGNTFP